MAISDILDKVKKEWEVLKGEEAKDKLFVNENTFPDEATARREFERSKQKLFNVNDWSKLEGMNSTFQLYTPQGQKSSATKPSEGDYMLIILPGTTFENWVLISKVTEEEDVAEFVVHPSQKPQPEPGEEGVIKHFFVKEASSTFRVYRDGTKIMGFEIGRHEAINNHGDEAGDRALLNTFISEGGWAGFQDYQWDRITKYYVHLEELPGK
ncbi:hypothetical protein [Rufibacter roseus]|uniref:Uncharacterized protein n=1 Tax=Rufibacter roseus TaxID=1567108 RepID=A0ABW2DRU2_9BACT|nr:hypothetical protein [Rufibacter roseus]